MSTEKKCIHCLEVKPLTDFYKAGKYYQSGCKSCHNKRRVYHKRPTGYNKLSNQQKSRLRYLLSVNTMKDAARLMNINYYTLRSWKSKYSELQNI